MGDPVGPGKQYCTACGEVIDRDARFCTYCGAETNDREFPTERSGPATASDGRSLRDSGGDARRGPSRERAGQGQQRARADSRYPDDTPGLDGATADEYSRNYGSPRIGMGSIGRPRSAEPIYSTIGKAAVLGIGGVVLLGLVSAIAGVVFLPLLPDIAALGLATAVGQLVAFMGLGLSYLRYRGYDRQLISSYLGIRRPTLKEIGMIILGWITILVLIIIVGLIVQAFLPEPAENQSTAVLEDNANNLNLYIGAVAFMFLIVGPCEELLYRGIVQNRLRERLPAVPAVLIASVIFASVHVVALAGGDPLAMATTVGVLFVPAIVLGAIYEYTGNIVVPALLHGLHNSVIVTAVFFAPEIEEQSAEVISMVLAVLPV